jgi:hypothetical protein
MHGIVHGKRQLRALGHQQMMVGRGEVYSAWDDWRPMAVFTRRRRDAHA